MSTALYLVADQKNTRSLYTEEYLADLYREECDLKVLPFVLRNFRQFLEEGFEGQMLAEAIKRTAMAPRPSWYYLDAIIKYCRASHIYTYEDFLMKKHHRKGEDLPY